MLLVVDAGNTNVVFAVHDGKSWRGIWRIATEPQRTSDEYAVWLLTLLSFTGLKPGDIDRAVIGTVVPCGALPFAPPMPRMVSRRSRWLPGPAWIGASIFASTTRPRSAQIACSTHWPPTKGYGGPLIVIDFGTATTFDVVAPDGGIPGRRHRAWASTCPLRRCIRPPLGCRASASGGPRR